MRQKIEYFLSYIQYVFLFISFVIFRFFIPLNKNHHKWVVGVDEIASNIFFIGNILEKTTTVSFSKNKFYTLKYDYNLNISNKYIMYICRLFYGPLLLGYLVNKNSHFFYIWSTGFLLNRKQEFRFLKYLNKKIVCCFVGDDIRSLVKTIKYSKSQNEDTYANYYGIVNPVYLTDKYEFDKREIARITDKYADIVFNAKYDQMSYLQSKQFNWIYTYDKNKFFKNDNKFKDIKKIKILHAPSNAVYKGTQLVRAAIKKLQIENYDFDYIELQNMQNEVVLEHLKSSHVVLNSFYSYVPGLFGIEAMANHCAVLMSADPSIEIGLPQDSKDAWLITKYWEVYDNLKYLLDNPEKIKYYADRGYDFAYKHYTYEAASEYINKVLKENGVIE